MEDLAAKYAGKAVFVFVYTREVHPETEGSLGARAMPAGSPNPSPRIVEALAALSPLVQTDNREQRALRAAAVRRAMRWDRRVLVDEDGDASVLQQYGSGEDLAVVIDTDGRVVWRQDLVADNGLAPFLNLFLGRPALVP